MLRISASLLFVSSKPGISTTVTQQSSRNCCDCMWVVQDSKPSPTRCCEPSTRLTNVLFPVPVPPIRTMEACLLVAIVGFVTLAGLRVSIIG
ncbi:hypothetical protein B0H14DRAFT_2736697 [Mycena olivaceomarginata]|nr:hypothetical protein B0H14DRAFT_2736697 [Mycena olivaceomarginata]